MQEAGLMNFLRTILILLLIYYAFKIVARYVFPLFFKRMMKNVEKKFNEQQGYTNAKQEDVKVGETVVQKKPKEGTKNNDRVGEYVDYEELD